MKFFRGLVNGIPIAVMLWVMIIGVVLLLTGCGGGGSSAPPTTNVTPPVPEPPTELTWNEGNWGEVTWQ